MIEIIAPRMLLRPTATPIPHMAKTAEIEKNTKIHFISFNENPPSI